MSEAWDDRRTWSLRLSQALDDIGVTRRMVDRRRRTWLRREALQKLLSLFLGSGMTMYNFGSQSEGTTTLGMHSDIDILFSQNDAAVLLDLSEWQQGKDNLLVVNTERSPPQHCNLQRLGRDRRLPNKDVEDPYEVVDNDGKVLLTTKITEIFLLSERKLIFYGPSRSLNKNVDMVQAFPCARLPAECQFLFERPRPGHWPTKDMLAQASAYPVFLVPAGYPDSPYHEKLLEWRFSTSLMERLLIFSFNTTQLKVFVLLKIIRKAFIKIVVGDNFSTFHMKTAMMFTIESYPPDIW
ncbi:uncharacterized protein LOC128241652 [Mya arenaria]|uniref:uncharacterized protein LOC128241652 n=1 Tax=Mya arenaria TaxID=6604 RepID=UPI0022E66FEC|nr:uncharacterized protein LOC128241652 [Mya arenaria]XP_052814635.1 uncharacterized protein LOC128241652 [Mya arenaria]